MRPYLRRLLYQELPKRFPQLVLQSVAVGRGKCVRVQRASAADQAEQRELQQRTIEVAQRSGQAVLHRASALPRLLAALIDARVPLIGHNLCLDLMHLLHKAFLG